MTSVVVLSRFPEIFAGFRESVDRDAPEWRKINVRDGASDEYAVAAGDNWFHIGGRQPFQIAVNANIGWRCTEPTTDLIYAGDDTRIIEPNTIKRLREVAYSEAKIGIVAARVVSAKRSLPMKNAAPFRSESFVAFIFVFIKREVIDRIGYLDEKFEGYGWEDVEYCVRARQAGFEVGFADGITIQHGVDGKPHMSTFLRLKTHEQIAREDAANAERFAEKYGLPNDRRRIWEFVRNLK